MAATCAHQNTILYAVVSWKSEQDRYKKIQDVFNKGDRGNKRMSGVEGDVVTRKYQRG